MIIAGGQAKRLGGANKSDIMVGAKTCFERSYETLRKSLSKIVVSGQASRHSDLEFIEDWPSGRLDGGVAYALLGCLSWAVEQELDYIVTTPVDTPFLQADYVSRLLNLYADDARPVVYDCNGRIQGLHALWPTQCFQALKFHILDDGDKKIGSLHAKLKSRKIHIPIDAYDPFLNLNTAEAIKQAQEIAEKFEL